jgi:hypothetical protein
VVLTVEIRYFGIKDVYETKSFRCQSIDNRLYQVTLGYTEVQKLNIFYGYLIISVCYLGSRWLAKRIARAIKLKKLGEEGMREEERCVAPLSIVLSRK